MSESPYKILGVKKTASADEIRQAYRKLARKYHPDVNPGDDAAEDRFKNISAAYDVLSDDKKRKAYDEFGEDSLKGGFDPDQARSYQRWKQQRARGAQPFQQQQRQQPGQDFDFGDLFGFGRGARGPRRGADVQAVLDMDLGQAIAGGEVRLEVPGRKPMTVRVPPGADDGSTIRLKGKGSGGADGGPAGDLVIRTRVRAHPSIRRDGLDLHLRTTVSLDEAYNGATIEVPTFDGPIKLKVPPLSQPGSRLRVRGKGVKRKDKRGDLLVELQVRLPDKHDDDLAAAIKAAREQYSEPVRREVQL